MIEWILRADPSHELPLHDLLSDYGISEILKSSDTIEEKYQSIYEIIEDSHDLKYAIRFEPLVTMVSSTSLKKPEVLEFIAKAKVALNSLEDKPLKQVTKAFEPSQKRVAKPKEEASQSRKDEISDKIAESTLLNWQKNDRVKYESLKNDYLKSLVQIKE